MNKYYMMKIRDGRPYQRSTAIESKTVPELEPGWDEVWTQAEWNVYSDSVMQYSNVLSKEYIQKAAADYQDSYFDSRAVSYCINVKASLINQSVDSATSLSYQMVEACSRWINKVWGYAYLYEAQGVSETNYSNDVGLPPCSFRDILWIVDPSFQQLEPNRPVNTDINYYINWN